MSTQQIPCHVLHSFVYIIAYSGIHGRFFKARPLSDLVIPLLSFSRMREFICVGYANLIEKTNHLPPAVWLARRIAWYLSGGEQRLAVGAGPDAKVLVRVERNGSEWKPLHVSLSLSHRQDCDWLKLRQYAEGIVEEACKDMETPELTVNGGGMFVSVGPNGDNGLSGKKLVIDAYGSTVPIGGGA